MERLITEEELEGKYLEFDNKRNQIRNIISGVYDIQKLRMATGNRITQSFYISMGIKSSETKDSGEKDVTDFIKVIKNEYSRISDGIIEKNATVKKMIKDLNTGDKPLKVIKDEIDYKMIRSYMLLLESEEESVKTVEKLVKMHPLNDKFFSKVKGCGPLMSAVCLAYLDPYKAKYASSFQKYCGLDTVQDTDKSGNRLFTTSFGTKMYIDNMEDGEIYYKGEDGTVYCGLDNNKGSDDDGGEFFITSGGRRIIAKIAGEDCDIMVDANGDKYVFDIVVSEHGRRKGDTVMADYQAADGEIKQKRSITYNAFVKTKLMGVLTGCLMKAKDPVYTEIYYDYRKRLDGNVRHCKKSAGHKNMMAQRYMIKRFLCDLWVAWRELEGLEVSLPYEVAKLGHEPHKYNKYQVEVAEKHQHMKKS